LTFAAKDYNMIHDKQLMVNEKETVNMFFLESTSYDPAYNLALEEYIFKNLPSEESCFMLWQNDHTIVVGKHQNTIEEINLPYVKEHGITVVRRLSGGGSVYHDLGNINFTFISGTIHIGKLNMQIFCQPVVRVLESLGVKAQIHGRNDITINGKKFSGNSQYIKNDRVMHHGTLMFDSDLSVIEKALKVAADKIESKGIKSIRSRITNIRPHLAEDMGLDEFKDVLIKNIIREEDLKEYSLSSSDILEIQKLKEQKYDTWEWNYGHSPAFSIQKQRRIEGCGKLEISMEVKDGIIMAYESHGDYFGNGDTKELKALIVGCPFNEEALLITFKDFNIDSCYSHLSKEDFISLLLY